MNQNQTENDPGWIPVLWNVAVFIVCLAALSVFFSRDDFPVDHSDRPIADISVNLNGQAQREHCTTCHPQGAKAISFQSENGATETLKPHPDIRPHSIEKLGCTGCHLGEGMALDKNISHGISGLGARQVLQGNEVQARCFVCHSIAPKPGGKRAWNGYVLFRRKACGLCHYIQGLDKGGRYGPNLSQVGSRLGLKALVKAVKQPRKEPPNSIMPKFPISSNGITDLSYFLKSRVENPNYTTPMLVEAGEVALPKVPRDADEDVLPSGLHLMGPGRCLGCHKYGGEDGRISPDLTSIGRIRSTKYIKSFLTGPQELVPGALMPRTALTSDQVNRLSRDLSQLADAKAPNDPRRQYMTHCQRCHAANGDGQGLIQPNLARFPRAFVGNKAFYRHIPDQRIQNSLAEGIPGTPMPAYEGLLAKTERNRLMDLIFHRFIRIEREDKASFPPLPEAPAQLAPSHEIDRLYRQKCARCHGVAGTGTGVEYREHLPRPRNLNNSVFMQSISDQRIARSIVDGVAGTGMPAFRSSLSSKETWGMVDKVRRFALENTWEVHHQ